MSVRVNQRWPDGLKERVEAKVGKSKVTEFTVEALEKALSGVQQEVAPHDVPGAPADGPASSRASSLGEAESGEVPAGTIWAPELSGRRCSRCDAPISSPTLRRHDGCGGGKVVPEPV